MLDLVVEDEGDDLDAAELAARDAAITAAWQAVVASRGKPISEILANLRSR